MTEGCHTPFALLQLIVSVQNTENCAGVAYFFPLSPLSCDQDIANLADKAMSSLVCSMQAQLSHAPTSLAGLCLF